MPYDDRPTGPGDIGSVIHQAMVAFAAGDALGVPWEGRPPERIDPAEVVRLPAPDRGWPRGSTSDDTAQMVLVARHLTDRGWLRGSTSDDTAQMVHLTGRGWLRGSTSDDTAQMVHLTGAGGRLTSLDFLTRLAEAAPAVRGIGPTTHAALAHFRATGELPVTTAADRPTNGAAMRIAPVGWAVPPDRPESRRALCEALSVATHRAPAAVGAACVIAAMASWAVERVSVADLLEVAVDEAGWAGGRFAPMDAVREAARGRWTPPPEGISLDAVETAAAVVHVLREAPDLADALPYAVSLGGDTDTVAALAGGVLGARGGVDALEWLGVVNLAEWPDLADLAVRLAALRAVPPPR